MIFFQMCPNIIMIKIKKSFAFVECQTEKMFFQKTFSTTRNLCFVYLSPPQAGNFQHFVALQTENHLSEMLISTFYIHKFSKFVDTYPQTFWRIPKLSKVWGYISPKKTLTLTFSIRVVSFSI